MNTFLCAILILGGQIACSRNLWRTQISCDDNKRNHGCVSLCQAQYSTFIFEVVFSFELVFSCEVFFIFEVNFIFEVVNNFPSLQLVLSTNYTDFLKFPLASKQTEYCKKPPCTSTLGIEFWYNTDLSKFVISWQVLRPRYDQKKKCMFQKQIWNCKNFARKCKQ